MQGHTKVNYYFHHKLTSGICWTPQIWWYTTLQEDLRVDFFFPSVLATTVSKQQTLWPQPDVKQIQFCCSFFSFSPPFFWCACLPVSKSCFWAKPILERGALLEMDIEWNGLMQIYWQASLSLLLCGCASLFLCLQRRVWTGCGEWLPSAPRYLPRWDGTNSFIRRNLHDQ